MSHRGLIGVFWLTDALRDGTFAVRLLRRNLLFTATATLSLAIGIGANTAVFMVIDALLLQPPAAVRMPRLWAPRRCGWETRTPTPDASSAAT
jgi:hypothetical protein